MKRMSFVEAVGIIENHNLFVLGNNGKEEPKEAKYILKYGTDNRFAVKATFKNGYEVVQFAKYIEANVIPEATKEELVKAVNDNCVRDWWVQKSAESTREYFKEQARKNKEIVRDDTDNN